MKPLSIPHNSSMLQLTSSSLIAVIAMPHKTRFVVVDQNHRETQTTVCAIPSINWTLSGPLSKRLNGVTNSKLRTTPAKDQQSSHNVSQEQLLTTSMHKTREFIMASSLSTITMWPRSYRIVITCLTRSPTLVFPPTICSWLSAETSVIYPDNERVS